MNNLDNKKSINLLNISVTNLDTRGNQWIEKKANFRKVFEINVELKKTLKEIAENLKEIKDIFGELRVFKKILTNY